MFGAFRLFLAIIVVLYHSGIIPFNIHMGVSAVVVFYVLSGYVMSGLWDGHYQRMNNRICWFYADRALRILPQYFALSFLSLAVIFGGGIRLTGFQTGGVDWVNIVAHLTVVPLSFAGLEPRIGNFMLIPQAWSLGTEIAFYIILQFLFVNRKMMVICLVVSLSIYAYAVFGFVDRDIFAYRLLPGCLFLFLVGGFINRKDRVLLMLTVSSFILVNAVLIWDGSLTSGYNTEIFLGGIVAIGSIGILKRISTNKFDGFLGDLSYSVYLGHLIILSIVWNCHIFDSFPTAQRLLILFGSLLCAYAVLILDKPVAAYRRRLRRRQEHRVPSLENAVPVASCR